MKKAAPARLSIGILLFILCASFVNAQTKPTYAGVGFIGLSPNLVDTVNAYSISDTLYGGTVSFSVNPWFTVGAEVLYLGDIYYDKDDSGVFSGPLPWATLAEGNPTAGTKAGWTYFESLIYAPLTFNLTIPLGIIKPYFGIGPAFYFRFPSTNGDADFTAFLANRYGDGERIRTGLTARAGFDVFVGESLSLGVGYILREDLPALVFEHLSDPGFFLAAKGLKKLSPASLTEPGIF